MSDQRRDMMRQFLISDLEQTIEERLDRYLAIGHQPLIGNHHFSHASDECLALFRDGYFTSCIMVSQAVCEGILEFVARRNNVNPIEKESKQSRAGRMEREGILTHGAVEAFARIQASNRNDFHHMNPPVAKIDLVALADRNIRDLAVIETEVFECSYGSSGKFVPKNPKYWDLNADGSVPVYIRGF